MSETQKVYACKFHTASFQNSTRTVKRSKINGIQHGPVVYFIVFDVTFKGLLVCGYCRNGNKGYTN